MHWYSLAGTSQLYCVCRCFSFWIFQVSALLCLSRHFPLPGHFPGHLPVKSLAIKPRPCGRTLPALLSLRMASFSPAEWYVSKSQGSISLPCFLRPLSVSVSVVCLGPLRELSGWDHTCRGWCREVPVWKEIEGEKRQAGHQTTMQVWPLVQEGRRLGWVFPLSRLWSEGTGQSRCGALVFLLAWPVSPVISF